MLSVVNNCCIESSKHWKSSRKNIKFIDQYNWEGLDFLSRTKDRKKFGRNNKTIALNILYVPHNTKTINIAHKSKHNRKSQNQVVLLMITNGKQSDKVNKWHYITLKSVHTDNGLFRGTTSNNHGDFYCLGCLHSFRTEDALKNMKDYVVIMIIAMQKCLL